MTPYLLGAGWLAGAIVFIAVARVITADEGDEPREGGDLLLEGLLGLCWPVAVPLMCVAWLLMAFGWLGGKLGERLSKK